MEQFFRPFIAIYHVVRNLFTFSSSKEEKKEQESDALQHEVEALMKEQKDPKKKTKERPLASFRYKAKNSIGKKIQGTMEGESAEDVRSFLTNEGYKVLSVTPRSALDIDINLGSGFKAADLSFTLTQLSTYIKAGIPLIDSMRILEKQAEKPEHRKIYQKIIYELLKGENLSDAMAKQKDKFPKLLINMVKTAELTGDLTYVFDDMADYYTSKEETRKQMVSAMTYPVIVLCIAVAVLIFVLVSIVPQFVDMYESNNAEMPGLTLTIMDISTFLVDNYILIIVAVVLLIFALIFMYKKVRKFRKGVQVMLMHIPVISKIIIYSEVYNFTKTFASLLNHGVFITDSMEILSRITNNEVYKDLINKSIINLNKGASVSDAFKGSWAFPVAAYEMIVTGENTGQLGVMMDKVANYYQSLHKNLIKQMQSLMEPIMIGLLAFIVGIILLSVVMPMFDIYGKIQ